MWTTRKGYRRLRWRGGYWYEQRAVIVRLLEAHPSPFFPEGLTRAHVVHHQDFNKGHNCHPNLIVMDKAIHDAVNPSLALRCPYTGRFLTRREMERMRIVGDVPEWVRTVEIEEAVALV